MKKEMTYTHNSQVTEMLTKQVVGRCWGSDLSQSARVTMWSNDCLYANIPPLTPISSSIYILTQRFCESWAVLPVTDDLRAARKKRSDISAAGMDIQQERRRLLDAEDGHDPTGLISEQDAYLRLVHTRW